MMMKVFAVVADALIALAIGIGVFELSLAAHSAQLCISFKKGEK